MICAEATLAWGAPSAWRAQASHLGDEEGIFGVNFLLFREALLEPFDPLGVEEQQLRGEDGQVRVVG